MYGVLLPATPCLRTTHTYIKIQQFPCVFSHPPHRTQSPSPIPLLPTRLLPTPPHSANYLVEVEVVLPAEMTVRESHDIALALQHKIESKNEVERAFVHVDWQARTEPGMQSVF